MDIIESLSDRDSYIRLGRGNTTPGANDDDTIAWALDATRARIADLATAEDIRNILAWVREGEVSR